MFNPIFAKEKPENFIHKENTCLFCNVNSLENILVSDDNCIWLVNRHRTLENTWQTVVIELDKYYTDILNCLQAEN
ncbi:DUF4931 domain-containing protein [Leuconostoc gelidum]|uniref:DUF4931 domain-containing protein n=1 Tax=Leuconostoc gelidum TaxID=1244 RepID=UPI0015765809|nr:DUF4931 domain-containing protein [Leuconostoc gelidum subsp. gelidum]MBZ6001776.1 DUF4931 domain-containing protein [Leuconostoc gelidum subsp. gelidum]